MVWANGIAWTWSHECSACYLMWTQTWTTFHSTVSRFKPLTSLDYYVHSALAADIHSLALRTIFSQAVCSKAWKFLWWVGLLLEDQESESSTKDYEGKPRLWLLLQVHWNKPNGMFYVSCSIVTARNIWNWKYSKVTTDEAFWSPSCCNSQLEWFPTTCSQTLEAVITNWYKSSNDNPDCSI